MSNFNGRCEAASIYERDATECKFGTVNKFAPDSEVSLKYVPVGGDLVTATGDMVQANAVGTVVTTVSLKTADHYEIVASGTGPNGNAVTATVPLAVKGEGSFTSTEIVAGYFTLLLLLLFFLMLTIHLSRLFRREQGMKVKDLKVPSMEGVLYVRNNRDNHAIR